MCWPGTRSSAWLLFAVLLAACAGPPQAPDASAPATGTEAAAEPTPTAPVDGALLELSALESELGLAEKWTGDLDGMIERRVIRALVTYFKTSYYVACRLAYDQMQKRGIDLSGR